MATIQRSTATLIPSSQEELLTVRRRAAPEAQKIELIRIKSPSHSPRLAMTQIPSVCQVKRRSDLPPDGNFGNCSHGETRLVPGSLRLSLRGIRSAVKKSLIIALLFLPFTRLRAENQRGTLTLGDPMENTLQPGPPDDYELKLTADQYVRIDVIQLGVDIAMDLIAPSKTKPLIHVDRWNARTGIETLEFIAYLPGEYTLKILAVNRHARPGRYRVELTTLRPAVAEDYRRIEDLLAANKTYNEAQTLRRSGDLKSASVALAKYRSTLDTWKHYGMARWEASSLTYIAELYDDLNANDDELRYELAALPVWATILDLPGEAETLHNIGVYFFQRGDCQKAIQYFAKAAPLWIEAGDTAFEAATVSVMGQAYATLGDFGEAKRLYEKALELSRSVGDGEWEAWTLHNLGILHESLNDLEAALAYYLRAYKLNQSLDPEMAIHDLHHIGGAYVGLKKYDYALRYLNLALTASRKDGSPLDVAMTLSHLGRVLQSQHREVEAIERYREALEIRRKAHYIVGEAESLQQIASLLGKGRTSSQAVTLLEESVRLRRQVNDKRGEAFALGALAAAELNRDPKKSLIDIQSAVELADKLQVRTLSQDLREPAFASTESLYEIYLNILINGREWQQAFDVFERSRARSLLAMLAERDLIFPSDVPAEIQETRRLNAAAYDRVQSDIAKLSPTKDSEKVELLHSRMLELGAEREQIADEIKKTSPRFAALQYPQPLDLTATRKILDSGTVLLSYSVVENHTVLFVVLPAGTHPGFSVFTIKATKEDLQRQVRNLRALIEQKRGVTDSDFSTKARSLYDLLLKPAESLLAGSERLLIVADGPLRVLPFAALLREQGQYVAEWKPVHSVVSATVYAELKKTRRQFAEEQAIEMAAFGDPVYPPTGPEHADSAANPDVQFAEERGFTFTRLPFSREEVEDIGNLFAGHSQTYLGKEATEEQAKALGTNVRYVHFATHGYLDERFPLNSAVVLTIPSRVGEGQENGLLQAWEIFEQVRLDADLVTLSACNTGLGQELNGEGLIGLTRAFQYAGARSVLASLWSVNDLWTMELMKEFYGQLKAGASKDRALQAAQVRLIHSAAASSPYYWAAFSLNGDWQ
jgi:CHAT domain-containing protein